MLNQFWTEQGQCDANLHKCETASSDKCLCGQPLTSNHMWSCAHWPYSQTVFLLQLHCADNNAVIWLRHVDESTCDIINPTCDIGRSYLRFAKPGQPSLCITSTEL